MPDGWGKDMAILSKTLVTLTALEFFYIFYLETVVTYCLLSGTEVALFLINIIAVAACGAASSNPKILPIQGGPAVVYLVLLLAFSV